MRRRITKALVAAAAAGATITTFGFAAAGSAGAATTAASVPHHFNVGSSAGPPVFSPPCKSVGGFFTLVDNQGCAGYVATGRDFRFAQSVITVPTLAGTAASPILTIALSSADSTAGAGIISCDVAHNVFGIVIGVAPGDCVAGTYLAFALTAQNGVVAPADFNFTPLTAAAAGDGVFFSIYDNVAGNSLHFVITTPGANGIPGTTVPFTESSGGAIYNHAEALVDWNGIVPAGVPVTGTDTRVAQFFQGRFTTVSGQRGSFTGPWNLNPVEATSNGLAPPSGTLLASPSYLWTNDAMPGDAFGVWLRAS